MATNPYSTSTPSTGPGRRTLAGAALALLGTADASAAPMPAESPDAALIALCAEFDAISRVCNAATRKAARAHDDDGVDRALTAAQDAHAPLLDQILELPPATLEGARALAASLIHWTTDDYADDGSTDDLLCRTLLAGLAGPAIAETRESRRSA